MHGRGADAHLLDHDELRAGARRIARSRSARSGSWNGPERIVLFMIGAFTNRMAGVLWVILVLSILDGRQPDLLHLSGAQRAADADARTASRGVFNRAFFWTDERATLPYDLWVIAILAFVWLTPPDWLWTIRWPPAPASSVSSSPGNRARGPRRRRCARCSSAPGGSRRGTELGWSATARPQHHASPGSSPRNRARTAPSNPRSSRPSSGPGLRCTGSVCEIASRTRMTRSA